VNLSEYEQILKQILKQIVSSTPGLRHAIIIDEAGITITSESKFSFTADKNVSIEKIGAIGGAVFTAGEEQGYILGYGNIDLQITEYDKGLVFAGKVGKGVLCVITDKNVQIGYVRTIIKRFGPKISHVLNKYFETEKESLDENLKKLIGTDHLGFL